MCKLCVLEKTLGTMLQVGRAGGGASPQDGEASLQGGEVPLQDGKASLQGGEVPLQEPPSEQRMPPPEAMLATDDTAGVSALPAGDESPFAASGLQHEAGTADVATMEPSPQPQASAPADLSPNGETSGHSAAVLSADVFSVGGGSLDETSGQTPGQNREQDKLQSTASASAASGDKHTHQDEIQGHPSGQGAGQISSQTPSGQPPSDQTPIGQTPSGQTPSQTSAPITGQVGDQQSGHTAGSGSFVTGEPASATSDKTGIQWPGGVSAPPGGAADVPPVGDTHAFQRNEGSGNTQTLSAPEAQSSLSQAPSSLAQSQSGLNAEHGASLEASTADATRTEDADNVAGFRSAAHSSTDQSGASPTAGAPHGFPAEDRASTAHSGDGGFGAVHDGAASAAAAAEKPAGSPPEVSAAQVTAEYILVA